MQWGGTGLISWDDCEWWLFSPSVIEHHLKADEDMNASVSLCVIWALKRQPFVQSLPPSALYFICRAGGDLLWPRTCARCGCTAFVSFFFSCRGLFDSLTVLIAIGFLIVQSVSVTSECQQSAAGWECKSIPHRLLIHRHCVCIWFIFVDCMC